MVASILNLSFILTWFLFSLFAGLLLIVILRGISNLPERAEGERSWRVSIEEIEAKNYDMKAVNPNKKVVEDKRTPEELISLVDSMGKEIEGALAALKNKGV